MCPHDGSDALMHTFLTCLFVKQEFLRCHCSAILHFAEPHSSLLPPRNSFLLNIHTHAPIYTRADYQLSLTAFISLCGFASLYAVVTGVPTQLLLCVFLHFLLFFFLLLLSHVAL
jgi:hypothetical protein